ncbi:hypothetical protein [Marinobacter orientalis]|uniref:Uncharacterized protein n=1 Tax=Marinobacter orientalis TaxID=1928859 RepID=A0A7Y0WT11_9GAMM|nr:hypothetical protein [Marinobacter orientalis]NMT64346.1 hypothetical protein [Marinobacter orientalis]TGX50683.1 hypothetical protein DIT72_01165 [Marinobacter orientalis]
MGRKTLDQVLNDYDFILAEAAIVERLRKNEDIRLDPLLVHAPLIYSREGRSALSAIYSEYLTIAKDRGLPMRDTSIAWLTQNNRRTDSVPKKARSS